VALLFAKALGGPISAGFADEDDRSDMLRSVRQAAVMLEKVSRYIYRVKANPNVITHTR
jgi:hypothetical protein